MDFHAIFGSNEFLITDYAVVGVFLGVILVFGMYHFAFSNGHPENFLIGGRTTRTCPVAVSTAMLYFSALAIIERPADIYYYGIESFMFTIILVVLIPVSAFLFVPMMHKMQLTSVHQYIGHRFDSTVLRWITSSTNILHQLCLMCIVQGVASVAMERYFGVPILTSIIGIGAFSAFGVTLGGLNATIWTQVFNFHWMSLFLLVLSLTSASKAGGFVHAFELAAEHGRLKLFNFSLDPFTQHNFYNFLVGYGFLVLVDMASNQALALRYSSRPTSLGAMKSMLMSLPLLVFPSLFCLLIGIFLQASYAGCDPITVGKIDDPHDLIPHFVRTSMTFIPGIRGFFIASFLGSTISVYTTAITSITASAYQDIVSKLPCANRLFQSVTCCRIIGLTFSIVATTLTFLAVQLSYIEKAHLFSGQHSFFIFNSVLMGPLAAVFIMAMFFPCVNKYGAAVGFLGGVSCMGFIAAKTITSTIRNSIQMAPLPPIMGDCPDSAELNLTFFRFIPWHPKDALKLGPENIDLIADEIISLSYLLFPLVGTIFTMIISFPVSIFTGGLCLCASRKVPATLLHPFLRFCDCCIDSEERQLQHAISQRYVDRINSVHNIFPGSNTRLDSKPPSYRYSSVPNSPDTEMF